MYYTQLLPREAGGVLSLGAALTLLYDIGCPANAESTFLNTGAIQDAMNRLGMENSVLRALFTPANMLPEPEDNDDRPTQEQMVLIEAVGNSYRPVLYVGHVLGIDELPMVCGMILLLNATMVYADSPVAEGDLPKAIELVRDMILKEKRETP